MSVMQRKTLLTILSVVCILLLSGLVVRSMIVSDIQGFAGVAGAEKAGLLVSRAGNLVSAWTVLAAILAVLPVFLISRRPVEREQKTTNAPLRSTAAALPEKENAVVVPDAAALVATVQEEKELTISVRALGEEPDAAAEDEDAQVHVSDPDRLKKIIQGLEELAQAEALGRSLQRQQLELALHLSGAVEKTRESIQDREIRFDLECENGLTVQADPDCLAKIITNLLDNAAKAVQDGGAVTVSAASQNGHVVIAVKDTGAGIKRKDLPHIFERFYRASGSGIGLGLTIVQELVDACGGRIEVETTRGKGSLVTVRIPHA